MKLLRLLCPSLLFFSASANTLNTAALPVADYRPTNPVDIAAPVTDESSSKQLLGNATFQGPKPYTPFNNPQEQLNAYVNGRIAFYTWKNPSEADATRWTNWYEECVQHYEQLTRRPTNYYNDPNFGPKKVIANIGGEPMWCGTVNAAGCGDKQRLQTFKGQGNEVAANPNEKGMQAHWIVFYELGRGGAEEPFEQKGGWPRASWQSGFPHFVAAVCMQRVGGIDRVNTPGLNSKAMLDHLAAWERDTRPYVDVFSDPNRVDTGTYRANDVLAGMLFTLHQALGPQVVSQALANLSGKPQPTNATAAMCNLQDAFAEAAGRRLDEYFVSRWRLPQCTSQTPQITRTMILGTWVYAEWRHLQNVAQYDVFIVVKGADGKTAVAWVWKLTPGHTHGDLRFFYIAQSEVCQAAHQKNIRGQLSLFTQVRPQNDNSKLANMDVPGTLNCP